MANDWLSSYISIANGITYASPFFRITLRRGTDNSSITRGAVPSPLFVLVLVKGPLVFLHGLII